MRRYLLAALLAIALLALSVTMPAAGQSEEPTTTTTLLDPKFRVPLPPTTILDPKFRVPLPTTTPATLPFTGVNTAELVTIAAALLAFGILLTLPVIVTTE